MNPLTELAEYEELNRDLNRGKGPVQISGCMDSQKVHLMWEAGETLPWKLVVTYDDSRAKEIYEDFRCFTDAVWLYPAKDLLFYNADIHGNLITRERMQVLRHLIEEKSGVVVTTIDGLMDHLLPLSMVESQILTVRQGEETAAGVLRLRAHGTGRRYGTVFHPRWHCGYFPADGGASSQDRAVG